MDENAIKPFNRIYWFTCSLVFLIVIYRCVFVPFAHDEVATFHFYIQSGDFLPFLSHTDAMGHFLTNATSWVCFKLFGSSTLALRLPCILSFIILCIGVFKINGLFKSVFPKIIFSGAFVLSFNFVAFYSLCRGYGISMSLLVLAMYYFYKYIRFFTFRHFIKFLVFSQLALSANLTLVFVLALTGLIIVLMQLREKLFFKIKVVVPQLVYFSLILFWVKYAFFLQEQGALYYGSGDNYWKVTFETLIETIVFKNGIVNAVVFLLFTEMIICWIYELYKQRAVFLFHSYFSISFLMLCGLIISFYLLKKIFHVNYPEDRTGLFFYVFFMLSLVFMISEFRKNFQAAFLFLPLFFMTHFVYSVNLQYHPWRIYETIPERFFSTLVSEQKKAGYPVTVAGHRVREFLYGFMNYNSPVKLNHMTAPEALQMNCDYAIAYKLDKPWYDKYYEELDEDGHWDFTLLKRRRQIARKLLYDAGNQAVFSGNGEYFNFYERTDISFNTVNPLLAEFKISVEQAPVPFNAWLVLQIDGEDGTSLIRTPLNLVMYNWNAVNNFTTCIVSDNLPQKIKRVVAYLWNIDKKEIKLKSESFRLYQLDGEGITVVSEAKL